MEDGAAMLRTDWLGGKWLKGWEIGIKLPCGRFPHSHPKHIPTVKEEICEKLSIPVNCRSPA
jgi:hypothetical protein